VLAAIAAGGAVAARTRTSVRRMRAAAERLEPLEHDLDLEGAEPPVHLTVLGDSAAAGHGIADADRALPRRLGRALAGSGRAVRVRSLAVDGATTEDVRRRQVPELGPVEGDQVVVVGVGVNDALGRRPATLVRADTRELLDALAERAPDALVVLVTCPDLGVAPGLPAPLRGPVGWRCRLVAAAQCEVVEERDVAAVRLGRDLLRPRHFGDDGFHPGAEGIVALTERILDRLPGHVGGRR
jgi:lysophospholipase L1-like esterase